MQELQDRKRAEAEAEQQRADGKTAQTVAAEQEAAIAALNSVMAGSLSPRGLKEAITKATAAGVVSDLVTMAESKLQELRTRACAKAAADLEAAEQVLVAATAFSQAAAERMRTAQRAAAAVQGTADAEAADNAVTEAKAAADNAAAKEAEAKIAVAESTKMKKRVDGVAKREAAQKAAANAKAAAAAEARKEAELARALASAATRIQSVLRRKKAAKEMEQLQKPIECTEKDGCLFWEITFTKWTNYA
eukprot:gnl/TRDRNA2_/TRDRNA2_174079_c1_seq5.p1 gnl/TRDRNA2_/TRDRNA2_174079_c1~~gnl/TRDRNA2_/TRDRNA2_174079_c1_seq5.p1  ORF type:complete len:249 (+),score=79.31 gnl/TRDRNA2_/TRDRNA2_174079_c1_seq5:115-861(+)